MKDIPVEQDGINCVVIHCGICSLNVTKERKLSN